MALLDITALRRNLATRANTTSIRASTADRLDRVPAALPAVMVLDHQGEITARPDAPKRMMTITVRGVLILAEAGRKMESNELMDACIEELLAAFEQGIKCGQPTAVHDSWLESWDGGQVEWNGETYPGAMLSWTVETYETLGALRTA